MADDDTNEHQSEPKVAAQGADKVDDADGALAALEDVNTYVGEVQAVLEDSSDDPDVEGGLESVQHAIDELEAVKVYLTELQK